MRPLSVVHVCTVDITARILLLPQLRALREEGLDVAVICAPGDGGAELEGYGIRYIPWPSATRQWDLGSDARAFLELIRILREERFSVVHTHNPKPGVLGRVAARLAGVPRVLNTVHGYFATPEDPARRRVPVMAAEWAASRFSDLELFQSREDLAWAQAKRIVPLGRARYLGNGVDLSLFRPAEDGAVIRSARERLGIDPERIVVGIVGRMVQEKGFSEFFEASRLLVEAGLPVQCVAIGEPDSDKRDLIDQAAIDAAGDHVRFVGFQEDMPSALRALDVFVLPSWREGLPRSAIEAAATGLPLVLTDIRGCREVVSDEENGYLVPVRSPEILFRRLGALVNDGALRAKMGRSSRLRAEREFNENRVIETILDATCNAIS